MYMRCVFDAQALYFWCPGRAALVFGYRGLFLKRMHRSTPVNCAIKHCNLEQFRILFWILWNQRTDGESSSCLRKSRYFHSIFITKQWLVSCKILRAAVNLTVILERLAQWVVKQSLVDINAQVGTREAQVLAWQSSSVANVFDAACEKVDGHAGQKWSIWASSLGILWCSCMKALIEWCMCQHCFVILHSRGIFARTKVHRAPPAFFEQTSAPRLVCF